MTPNDPDVRKSNVPSKKPSHLSKSPRFDLESALKKKPLSQKKNGIPVSTTVAGGIAVVAICIAAYFAFRERPIDTFARTMQQKLGIPQGSSGFAATQPVRLVSATFDSGVVERTSSFAENVFWFSFNVKNLSRENVEIVTVHARSRRRNRPVADYECLPQFRNVKGGIMSGETVSVDAPFSWDEIFGKNNFYMADVPSNTAVEVSVDGKNWVEATYSGKPGDVANRLRVISSAEETFASGPRSKNRVDRINRENADMLGGQFLDEADVTLDTLRDGLSDIPDTSDPDTFFNEAEKRMKSMPGFTPASELPESIRNEHERLLDSPN